MTLTRCQRSATAIGRLQVQLICSNAFGNMAAMMSTLPSSRSICGAHRPVFGSTKQRAHHARQHLCCQSQAAPATEDVANAQLPALGRRTALLGLAAATLGLTTGTPASLDALAKDTAEVGSYLPPAEGLEASPVQRRTRRTRMIYRHVKLWRPGALMIPLLAAGLQPFRARPQQDPGELHDLNLRFLIYLHRQCLSV